MCIFYGRKYDFYSYRKQVGKNNKGSSFYQRLFLVLDLKDEGGAVYYIVQNNVKHKNMWNYNRSIRDNGVITIGTTFCMLNPKPIETILANDIPIIETDHPFVTLQEEPSTFSIKISENLPADDTRGFVVNGTQLTLHTFSCKTGVCSGYFCARQRIIELSALKKGCGCYHTGRNSSICFLDLILLLLGFLALSKLVISLASNFRIYFWTETYQLHVQRKCLE